MRTTLATPIGQVEIGTLSSYCNEFLEKQNVQYSRHIMIPITRPAPLLGGDLSNSIQVQSLAIELDKNLLEKYPIKNNFIYDPHFINELTTKEVNNSFISHVMKRKEEFYKPKLEMQDIIDLSIELAKKSYNNTIYAFHLELNKYQKYFIYANSNAFKLFISGPRHESTATPALFVKLIELNPDAWISGRYDDSVYLKELESKKRYVTER